MDVFEESVVPSNVSILESTHAIRERVPHFVPLLGQEFDGRSVKGHCRPRDWSDAANCCCRRKERQSGVSRLSGTVPGALAWQASLDLE